MHPSRMIVLLPCHTLDDFPTWLEESEADALLAAWTATWHPALIAAADAPPAWASVDLPPPDDVAAGVVPVFCEERFLSQANPDATGPWVRDTTDSATITAALAAMMGIDANGEGQLPGAPWADDFRALGLATLLAELLARRMRTEADLEATGFAAAVAAAARGAVAGDERATREALAEAFACLETTRSRYYSVESWSVDVVLLAASTLGDPLVAELTSPVPLGVVADGTTIRRLAEMHPDSLQALREAVAAGQVEPCGGRDDTRPLDTCSPEEIRDSLATGREAWAEHVFAKPTCYASITGGSSAILPQLLTNFGYCSAIWCLFDGSSLPDAGCGRILWEGSGGGRIEAIARPPLDAGKATTILELPDRIGDTLDHDHVAVVTFAHYAGTASRWHSLVRRIGHWSGLLGTFVTPSDLVARSSGSGAAASFEPDAFPVTLPTNAAASGDELDRLVAATRQGAARLMAAAETVRRELVASAASSPRPPAGRPHDTRRRKGWLPAGLFGRRRDDDALLLENGLVQLRPHPRTGGLLSLRRASDRSNRISQQLALRTTAAAQPGHWEPPEDRAAYSRMEADSITRHGAVGNGHIESRGRLVDASGKEQGRFTQRMSLVPGLPLAAIEVEVRLDRPVSGPALENHVACRFAWNENEDVELRRSLHLQSIVTERTRFTAPDFIEIAPAAARGNVGNDAVAILTGGLPWHLLASGHVLESILLAGSRQATCRLGVGIGLDRPWDAAVAWAAGGIPHLGPAVPRHVRLTVDAHRAGDSPDTLRVGLVESAGQAGEVRIEWGREVARAAAVDLLGHPLPDVVVGVAGRATTVSLARYQWLQLAIDFAPRPGSPVPTPGGAS